MTRIDFYHLQKNTLEDVLPKLLEKAYSTRQNIKVQVGNAERVEFLNTHLWTYQDESFLPHGSKKDGSAAEQPVFLSEVDDNPNNATLLFLVDGATADTDKLSAFSRVFNIFDGNNPESLDAARAYWKLLKSEGFELHYWQQDNQGSWHEK